MSQSLRAHHEQYQHDPSRRIVGLLFHLSRSLGTINDRRMAAFNVTGQQAALLLRTSSEPAPTLTQLATWLGTDSAGITRLVDRLEAKGLIERRASASDRRAVEVQPTDEGRHLIPDIIATFEGVTTHLLEGLTSEEIASAESSLRVLLHNLNRYEVCDASLEPTAPTIDEQALARGGSAR